MAFSKSIRKAQIPTTCHLCETDTKIKWKCIDCDLLMCGKCCEKVHPKFKNAKEHKVIHTKEVGIHAEEFIKRLGFTRITCKYHQDQNACLFCDTCGQLVCPSCMSKSTAHTGHSFSEIKESYEMKLERLTNALRKLRLSRQSLQKDEQNIDTMQARFKSEYGKVGIDIKNLRANLFEAVNAHMDKLIDDLDTKLNIGMNYITEKRNGLGDYKDKLREKDQEAESVMNSTDMAMFFEKVDTLDHSMREDIPPFILSLDLPKLAKGVFSESDMGYLIYSPETLNIQLNIKKKYSTDLCNLHCLASGNDNYFWLSDTNEEILQRIIPENGKVKVISTFKQTVFGMAVDSSNELLLATSEPFIKKMDLKTGRLINSKYSVQEPFGATAIHVSKRGEVIVGATCNTFTKTARNLFVVMNLEGHKQNEYELKRDTNQLIAYPAGITSVKNGNIFIIDHFSVEANGRVVILKSGGEILNTYTGTSNVNTKESPFNPINMVTTSLDNVIITDMDNSVLHILNSAGNLCTYVETSSQLLFPCSLTITNTDELYIGCSIVDKKENNKGILYHVGLSGC